MLTKRFALVMALALSLVLIMACSCTGSLSQKEQLRTTTQIIQKGVQGQLDNLDRDLSATASQLSSTGLSGTETRQILNGLVTKHSFVIDFAITDTAGKMVTIAPDTYSSYEGTDISTQEVTIKFNETKQPMLSQMFTSVEGMDAVVIMWPIFSEQGDFMGILSALFKPETLFAYVTGPGLKRTGVAVNVIQLDGLAIYDSEYSDTGKNLFIDPSFQPYTELLSLGHNMVARESGSGSYTFIDHSTGNTVKKLAYWSTVSLHGTPWRLACVLKVGE
jgi:hypothetical protein